ncbi:fimbrial biogenesis chaperone StbE [Orbus sasakiae]|uniref:Fimbrial biogenesis chaperone StbE n=1 Tax=Orbus sasakiae TaxID=1078475 RepID=A0ABP9MZZ7_9GAMM
MHNYKLWSVFNKLSIIGLLSLLFTLQAYAVVNVEGTRVVFNANDKTLSLSLANSEKHPTLIQMWVDDGDMLALPETIKSPIIISPPVFSMQASEIRAVRLMLASRAMLAKEQESLYWLNIYQIPPNTQSNFRLDQKVVLPLRIRMKIFIRPEGVRPLQQQDGYLITFKLTDEKGKTKLTFINPTAWHMNLNSVFVSGEQVPDVMLLPKSEYSVMLKKSPNHYQQIIYDVINDQGTSWQYQVKF